MKAVITKIVKNNAIVLKIDGSFECIPDKGYMVGQEIYLSDKKTNGFTPFVKIAAAAASLFLAIGGGAAYAYSVPQSYVSIDMESSIEFEVNIFNYVINATGVNNDGKAVLEKVEIAHKSMERAIEIIISQAEIDGYITPGEETVVIGVHSSNEDTQQKVMERATLQVEKSLDNLEVSTAVSIKQVSTQTIEMAKEMGTTGGKLELVEEYIESTGTEVNTEELIEKPVNELNEVIKNSKTEKEKENNGQSNSEKTNNSVKDKEDKSNKDSKDKKSLPNQSKEKKNPK